MGVETQDQRRQVLLSGSGSRVPSEGSSVGGLGLTMAMETGGSLEAGLLG